MSTQTITSTHALRERSTSAAHDQYTLWQILGIWACAALPMGINYWVILPLMLTGGVTNPFMYLFLMIAGLGWQSLVAYLLLRREVKPFTWQGVRARLWLQTPSDPRSGCPSKWLYLWTIPFIVGAFFGFTNLGWLNDLWLKAFPFLAQRPYAMIQNLADFIVGQWWVLGVIVVQMVLNYLLGEELIFRGILLPKMNGAFGKWDWLANHILFTVYHLHMPWNAPARLLLDWFYAWPARRFQSYWMSVLIHGFDAIGFLYMTIMAILGLVQ